MGSVGGPADRVGVERGPRSRNAGFVLCRRATVGPVMSRLVLYIVALAQL